MSVSGDKVQTTVLRNLSAVSLHKVVQVVGLVVTVALVPRLFGAEDYGRFAFVLSLSYLGQVLGDFGTLDVLGRFVPGMASSEASRLYMRTLAFKIVAGSICGVITTGAALVLAQWMTWPWAGLTGLGVALHIVAWVPFQFALGLNWVGTWMAEQAWRQWALLLLLLALLPPLGLGGALLAVLLMELIFCGLGLWWLRDYWHRGELRLKWLYLRPYVRFGLSFFLANLATTTLYRSGPALVELLTGDSRQTGYFNLALGLFLLAYVTVSQFAQGLIPMLSGFRVAGQMTQVRQWLRSFVRYGWWLSCLGALAVWLLADWSIPLVFGPEFAAVAASLKWVSLGMPLTALLWAGNVLATVTGRGKVKLGAAVAALLTFIVGTLWLTPLYGAMGAALALSLAVAANVVVLGVYLSSYFRRG
ncbi:MAG: oligosaccharide flippase family protein [Chloroflexi bacterium]|nr:oligosaccharide flippase family protein [Chloroflexota bacterium]